MSSAREEILGALGRALGGEKSARRAAALARLQSPRPNFLPARAQPAGDKRVEQFVAMALTAAATVEILRDAHAIPQAVSGFLAQHNIERTILLPPDASLDRIPWTLQAPLAIRKLETVPEWRKLESPPEWALGNAGVAVTGAFAGVAETGTVAILSGGGHPTALNFLPDTHVVILPRDKILGGYEEVWQKIRAAHGGKAALPRLVNFITGPSRSADIEQKIQLGAHGPRRLHILIVEEPLPA